VRTITPTPARTGWSSLLTPYLTKPWARKSSVWKWYRAAAARIADSPAVIICRGPTSQGLPHPNTRAYHSRSENEEPPPYPTVETPLFVRGRRIYTRFRVCLAMPIVGRETASVERTCEKKVGTRKGCYDASQLSNQLETPPTPGLEVRCFGHGERRRKAHEAMGRPDALSGFLEVVHRLFENGVFVSHDRSIRISSVLRSLDCSAFSASTPPPRYSGREADLELPPQVIVPLDTRND
jgi:hypothetical protein